MLEPVAQQEGRVFVKAAAVEHQQELAAVGFQPLDRMRDTARKIPGDRRLADVINEGVPLGVDRRDPGVAVEHEGPFGFLVPVQFANAAGVQAHVHAGNVA